ncbi:hypothetical protein ACLBWX_14475 [Methylobacterium sp. M6A4_1b]
MGAAPIAREVWRLEACKDSVGLWTIAIGHTSAQCDTIFARDVRS